MSTILAEISPFAADQQHLHHLFLQAGLSANKTWLLMILIAATLATVGLLGEAKNWPEHQRFYSLIALAACYYIGMSRIRPESTPFPPITSDQRNLEKCIQKPVFFSNSASS